MFYKKIFSYRSYLLNYLLIIFLLNFLLLNFPLLNVFGYEFSVFNSVLLTFISGFYIISLAKREGDFRGIISKLFLPSLLFLFIPFLVSVTNSFFTGFCSFSDGMFFYLIITFPAVIIGYAMGLTSFLFFKRFTRILFFLSIILILFIALAEFYFNPQVYFYNPVLGYLPGTIYDEGLSVDSVLITYRILNLLFFGGLLSLIILHLLGRIKFNKLFFFSYLVIIPALFILYSPSFGFSTTFGKLKDELNNKVSTEHFDIYFDERISGEYVNLIILHHEYFFKELKDYLQTSPSEKIESFIFNDRKQKKILFGSANADVAKSWLYSIYTTYDNYNTTLKHEIAHCFSAEFGEGPFKIADMVNPFLIEGLASASAPFYDENDIHFIASVAYNNNYKITIEKMFGLTSFFSQVSSLSYVYAGSFSKYLIDNYGIENFKLLYTEPDFQKVYNKSLKEFETEYFNFLKTFDTENNEDKAHYYFGRKAIFYKVCPRFIADRLQTAWNYYHNEDFKKAEEIFNYTLERAETYSAIAGLAGTFSETKRVDSAIILIKNYLDDFENTSYYYNLLFSLADLYAIKENTAEADSIYKKLIESNSANTINYLSGLRIALVNNGNLVSDYLTGSNTEKYSILKKLNKNNYIYSSFHVMADLSKALDEDYSLFVKQFDKTMFINNFQSAYAVFKLSEFMAENLDFNRARKMAALSLRFKDYKYHLFEENYKKMNWFYHNSKRILAGTTFNDIMQ